MKRRVRVSRALGLLGLAFGGITAVTLNSPSCITGLSTFPLFSHEASKASQSESSNRRKRGSIGCCARINGFECKLFEREQSGNCTGSLWMEHFCSYIRLLTFFSIERPATSGKQGQDFFSHMEKTFPGFEFHLSGIGPSSSFGKASKELAQGAISKLLYETLCF